MKTAPLLAVLILVAACADNSPTKPDEPYLAIEFDEGTADGLSESDRNAIVSIVTRSEARVRELLPGLPDSIHVTVGITNRNIDVVGGVTGRADRPGAITIDLSSVFPGGVVAAGETVSLVVDAFPREPELVRPDQSSRPLTGETVETAEGRWRLPEIAGNETARVGLYSV